MSTGIPTKIKRMNSLENDSDIKFDDKRDSLTSTMLNDQIANGKILNRSISSHNQEQSLLTIRAIICLIIWYFFSFTTLFLNKYIVSVKNGDATILGTFQMFFCTIFGYLQMSIPKFCIRNVKKSDRHSFNFPKFTTTLFLVGTLRYSTIFLGLIALWYCPVSFAETIKSSAPVFTVFIARFVLGEKTSLFVNLSLIPVMFGLAMCSAYELSFTMKGFIASLATNLSECLQNVFSKKLLTVERYDPAHLQFYTSISSFLIQLPCLWVFVDFELFIQSIKNEKNLILTYILAGISFHCQSFTEYMLLNMISPVTHSVANTTKRALLIWLSVLTFGNKVTLLSWIGTAIVIAGVFIYNKARDISMKKETSYFPLRESELHNI